MAVELSPIGIGVEPGYDDIYDDLYGGTAGDVLVSVLVAFASDPTESPVWTDITRYVRSFSTSRGRSSELDTFSAGTCTLVLKNDDRRFDPTYADSDYYPNVVPMRRLAIRAVHAGIVYSLFTGYVDGWPQGYRNPRGAEVTVTATDAFKILASLSLPSVWEQEVRADTPALWARLGEPAGTTLAWDASGNGRDGYYTDDPQLGQTGAILADDDQAATFQNIERSDGLDEAAHAIFPSPISGLDDFSIEFWWFNPLGGAQLGSVPLHQGPTSHGPAFSRSWQFTIDSLVTGFGPYSNTIYYKFFVYDTSGANTSLTYSYSYDDATGNATDPFANRWRHLVATRSGTDLALYVDGVLADTWSATRSMRADNIVAAPGYGTYTIDEVAVYIHALSADRVLAHYQAATAGWQGDTSDERIERVLDYADWPVSDRDISAGVSTLQLADLGGATVLGHMQDVELTESGRLFVSAAGDLTFVPRHAVLNEAPYSTSQATFGDAGSELKYADITFDYSDKQIRNDIRVTSPALPPQVASDATSQASYLKRGYTRQVLEASTARMTDAANYILGRYKDPLLRVESIVVKPGREPATLYPQALGRELGDRITVKRRPQAVGSAISQEVHIEHVAHDVDFGAQAWLTTWGLSPADTRSYWLLGTGALGSTTRLAY